VAAYLLVGEAPSAEFAARIAAQYKNCPHVHFIASFGAMLVGIWYLPEAKRWWLEFVAENPQVALGLHRAAVYRTEHPSHPEDAPQRPTVAEGPLAPCGSDCRACDHASPSGDTARGDAARGNAACGGCPALTGPRAGFAKADAST
jgi:hypothetical protein